MCLDTIVHIDEQSVIGYKVVRKFGVGEYRPIFRNVDHSTLYTKVKYRAKRLLIYQ